jgi:prophage regulatory protein
MSQIVSPRIIRLPELMNRTSLSRSTIYQLINEGKLNRIKLGARSMGFLETEVDDWISSKIAGASL